MKRHELLRRIHKTYRPRNYLEVGVREGLSLQLSRVPSIAIDPAFKVTMPIHCDVNLVQSTSDAFFAGSDPLAHFRPGRNPFRALARKDPRSIMARPNIELALIDGMHLFEYALRDFMNVERHAHWSSVIVLDDQLPRNVDEAARDRHTHFWTGDVYKVATVLRRFRPDLVVVTVDTLPTGVVVVFGADPTNTVLSSRYESLIEEYVTPDPQDVPGEIFTRKGAIKPRRLLRAEFWPKLVRARNLARGRSAFQPIRAEIETLLR